MKKYIGDRAFYKCVLTIMLPVLAQNVITNFVSLLDNIMVGRVGTEPMSGVAIVNQLLFVFNVCIFGGMSGAGIFTAQYYGKGDRDGVYNTIRAKAWIAIGAVLAAVGLFTIFGDELLSLFIHEGEDSINLTATLEYGRQYLRIMTFQLPLFAVVNMYASSLREMGNTRLPMKASMIAVAVNLTFNYILIYGKLGAPALGVVGAAYATVLARIVETVIVMAGSGFKGVWRTMRVPRSLAKQVTVSGLPLLVNELLWSGGMTTLIQIMSLKGVEVVSAENISNTVCNLFFCAFFSTGATISIMIGHRLGAGELEEAVDEDRKLIAFSVVFSTAVGLLMILIAPLLPRIYNTTEIVKSMAASFIVINAIMMPVNAFNHGCYYTLRSGGRVWITILYDSIYIWIITVPLTRILVKYSTLSVVTVYGISYYIDIIKVIAGHFLLKGKRWVNNLVGEKYA